MKREHLEQPIQPNIIANSCKPTHNGWVDLKQIKIIIIIIITIIIIHYITAQNNNKQKEEEHGKILG